MVKKAKRHVAEKKDYSLLVGIAVVVGIVLLGYYLLGAEGERVGQVIEVVVASCETGKFYLAPDGALERCNCAGGSCARGGCEGAVCKKTKQIIINPNGGKITVRDPASSTADYVIDAQTTLSLEVGAQREISLNPRQPAATPGIDLIFTGWDGRADATATSRLIVVTKDVTYTPNWNEERRPSTTVLIEAESYATKDPIIDAATRDTEDGCSGKVVSQIRRGVTTLTWNIDVPSTGTYDIAYSTATPYGAKLIAIAIDDNVEAFFNGPLPLEDFKTKNGQPHYVFGYSAGNSWTVCTDTLDSRTNTATGAVGAKDYIEGIQLTKGPHLLSFASRGDINLDWIKLVHRPICGNGINEGTEICDDGNTLTEAQCTTYAGSGSFCNADCSAVITLACPKCGDGIQNGPETCIDSGTLGQPNKCNVQCTGTTTPVCGNSVPEAGETCDAGSLNTNQACTAPYGGTCTYCSSNPSNLCQLVTVTGPRCGDGTTQTTNGEVCDGGTQSCTVSGYTGTQSCNTQCNYQNVQCITSQSCGDNVANGNEQCDGTQVASGFSLTCSEGYLGSKSCTSCQIVDNCVQLPPGTILRQAESFSSVTDTRTGGKFPVPRVQNGGTGSILTETGASLNIIQYSVTIPGVPGTPAVPYSVEYMVASPAEGGVILLWVDYNDPAANFYLAADSSTGSIPNTGGWNNWQTVRASFSVSPGQHNLQLRFGPITSGYGVNLDYFTLKPG